ncbi:unnamed protein product, partial [Phaeothamnion confervicola]
DEQAYALARTEKRKDKAPRPHLPPHSLAHKAHNLHRTRSPDRIDGKVSFIWKPRLCNGWQAGYVKVTRGPGVRIFWTRSIHALPKDTAPVKRRRKKEKRRRKGGGSSEVEKMRHCSIVERFCFEGLTEIPIPPSVSVAHPYSCELKEQAWTAFRAAVSWSEAKPRSLCAAEIRAQRRRPAEAIQAGQDVEWAVQAGNAPSLYAGH